MKVMKMTVLAMMPMMAGAVDLAKLPTAELDRGGLTYDFAKISEKWFAGNAATNYFAGFEWRPFEGRFFLEKKTLAENDPLREAIKGKAKWKVDGRAAHAVAGPELLTLCRNDPKLAGYIVSEAEIYSALPDAEGGEYLVTFRYRCANTMAGCREAYWVAGYADKAGGKWSGAYWHPLGNCDGRIRTQSVKLKVPKGKASIKFMFEFGGLGDFEVFDIAASKAEPPKTPVSLRCSIPDYLDGTFAVSEGQTIPYYFEWRANDGRKWEAEKFRIRFELPKGVTLRATNVAALKPEMRTARADGGESWLLEPRHGMGRFFWDLPKKDVFNKYTPFQMLLKPTEGVGAKGAGRIVAVYDGKEVSNVLATKFEVIPRIEVPAPRELLSGMNGGDCLFDFLDQGAFDEFAGSMVEMGMRCMLWGKWTCPPGCYEAVAPTLRRAGFTALVPYDCSLSDGYIVGDGASRPKDERFVGDVDWPQIVNASCPIAIYTEMPHVKKYFETSLKRILEGGNGMWANWEPYFFAGHGCWCDRCREAFAKYAGLDPETVKAAWPAEMKNGKYEDVYIEFRSKELAKVVKTIDRWVRKYTGGERSMGFMPGVAWCEMSTLWKGNVSAGRGVRQAREQSIVEYADSLEWIEPWGPYPRWDTNESFADSKWKYLCYWVGAKDVREQLEREYPAERRPKLMAHPSAKQSDVWVTEPEQLMMAYDAYFFNGWRAVAPYFFPRGYDARYWSAISRATRRAAKYEDYLLNGRRADRSVSLAPVAEYAMPCAEITFYVPTATDVSVLQSAAFRLGEATAVGVFNYWEKGEAFFDLKVRDTKAGRFAVVDEDGVLYAKSAAEPYWSSRELADCGIRLMVGAARTRVFEFRPVDGRELEGVKSVLTAARMAELYSAARDRLAREAAADHADEKAKRAAFCHAPEI